LRIVRPLADQGNAEAQSLLGSMYLFSDGVSEDFSQALAWDRKSAEHGYAGGQWAVGWIYEEGLGVPQDYVHAHMWYNLAISNASASDRPLMGKDRDRVAAKMTPAQIAEAQRLATEWTESHPSTR
jgi:TPR repeat protein